MSSEKGDFIGIMDYVSSPISLSLEPRNSVMSSLRSLSIAE